MEKRVCNIGDLPLDIIENILSYVPDGELFTLRSTETIQVAIEDLFRRRKKFNFSQCYNVNEAQLMEFLKDVHVQHRVTHLNFDHCYWLNFNIFAAAVKLNNLQELHVIDCRISSEVVVAILGLKLTSLSLSWSWNWLNNLKSTHQGVTRGTSPLSPLFTSLRHLVVFVPGHAVGPGTARCDFLNDVCNTFLQYCNGLISLKMYELAEEGRLNDFDEVESPPSRPIQFPRSNLLPSLESLILDLPSEEKLVISFVMKLYSSRSKAPLKEANFGKATLEGLDGALQYLNRNNIGEPVDISSLISAEKLTTLCIYVATLSFFRRHRMGLFMWENGTTPSCRVVSLNGMFLPERWVLDTVASKCPKLESLTLKESEMCIDDLVVGLTTIAQRCPQVTALIATLRLCPPLLTCLWNPDVLKAVGEFHALRKLHLTTCFFTKDATDQSARALSLRDILNEPDNEMILEEAMKCWKLYDLTENCKEVEEFKLCPPSSDKSITFLPESMLACVSKWKKLRHLHLVGVASDEKEDKKSGGYYISLITKGCRQLTTLGITEDFSEFDDRALNLALENAKSLKDLGIHTLLTWSEMMYNALRLCSNLERLSISKISISAQDVSSFQELLFVLPKLHVVIAEPYFISQNIDMYYETEARFIRLQEIRPSFFYKWGNTSNYSSNNFPVVHKDLQGRSFSRRPAYLDIFKFNVP